jgi:asparagine synthase (glutamine-hydrolysing)
MCGILIVSGMKGRPFSHKLLKGLRKRGPDEIGFWFDENIKTAHTRLSIIGLDERGTQPMENETHVIFFNGEIYNFHEIKRRLDSVGIHLTGVSDTEVLLHAWSHYGPSILKDLTGFWAFAVYEKSSNKLTIVRDQMGVKPLYYFISDRGVVVSSLIGTILEAIDKKPELDYLAMSEYVRYQYTFGDKTFFKDIKKVLPGHMVEIDLNDRKSSVISCYEDIFLPQQDDLKITNRQWMEETKDLLVRCILESTISDTSFTTFCSGGLDSSLITRIAKPEIAYHCNFSDAECNETFFARQAVEETNIRLFTVNAEESFDLVAKLKSIVIDFDELTIGSVILPLDDLLNQVKRRYKVILTGTGGDELFAGYVRYQLALGECFQDSYKELFAKMKPLKTASERFELAHHKGDESLYRFYDSQAEDSFHAAFEECHHNCSDVQAMLRFDRRYFLQGLLNIDDKMCGRHSLESRPSFLHQHFVRHIHKLNTDDLFHGGDLKPVLRELAKGNLPISITHRTDKMGFTTPIGSFINNSSHLIREQLMNSPFLCLYDLKKMNLTAESKFSRKVFGLLMLDLWLNHYVGS